MKELQKKIRKAEKAVEETEKTIAELEERLKQLGMKLSEPENASDIRLVDEYSDVKRQLDEQVERWERLAEEAERVKN